MNNPYDDMPLPTELQHLKNLIDDAEDNATVRVLRKLIKKAADEAPPEDVIRLAKSILQCGIDIEWAKFIRRN